MRAAEREVAWGFMRRHFWPRRDSILIYFLCRMMPGDMRVDFEAPSIRLPPAALDIPPQFIAHDRRAIGGRLCFAHSRGSWRAQGAHGIGTHFAAFGHARHAAYIFDGLLMYISPPCAVYHAQDAEGAYTTPYASSVAEGHDMIFATARGRRPGT